MEGWLEGWGRYPRVKTTFYDFYAVQPTETTIARGLGRSYADQSIGVRQTWCMHRQNAFMDFQDGVVTAQAGVTLQEILKVFLPRGWFLPVTPGTQFVTLGGAFASNIHGKNHHVEGSFADYVEAIGLFLASGEEVTLTPADPLFWATAGGMGLTGIITWVRLRLRNVETSYIYNRTYRLPSAEKILEVLQAEDRYFPYAVSWIDVTSAKGRGIVYLGRHAMRHEVSTPNPLFYQPSSQWGLPFPLPHRLLNRYSIAAFNEAYYRLHPPAEALMSYVPYFYPLDGVQKWNYIYGRRGFIQYQFVVPQAEDFLKILRVIMREGPPSFLTVLKRMGTQRGPLAFGIPGWTLAIDWKYHPQLHGWVRRLNQLVIQAGGRVYLTKDALSTAKEIEAMYPEKKTFMALRHAVDPQGLWGSEFSVRTGFYH
ncbi:MAG: FAD-binding protein [Bacteroidia bacterium]